MRALLRAEADNADAAQAASDVNGRIARALSRARAVAGVDASTTGYSSFQITEPNRPPRWRVSQTLVLEGSDFAALAALVSRMQANDGLVLSALNFSVSAATRRAAEDALTQQAIKNWQQRAQSAAQGFGSAGWRAGRITIQTNDFGRPQPMLRASMAAADAHAPVAVEGGMSEVTVTVSGEAILDAVRAR
jgi:predicted secreted protein